MLKAVGFVFAPIPSSPGAAFFRGALGGPAETIHKPMVYHQYVAARTIKMILYNQLSLLFRIGANTFAVMLYDKS